MISNLQTMFHHHFNQQMVFEVRAELAWNRLVAKKTSAGVA